MIPKDRPSSSTQLLHDAYLFPCRQSEYRVQEVLSCRKLLAFTFGAMEAQKCIRNALFLAGFLCILWAQTAIFDPIVKSLHISRMPGSDGWVRPSRGASVLDSSEAVWFRSG